MCISDLTDKMKYARVKIRLYLCCEKSLIKICLTQNLKYSLFRATGMADPHAVALIARSLHQPCLSLIEREL